MKRCRACQGKFEPQNTLQVACSPACALAYARTAAGERREATLRRQATREYRVAHMTRPQAVRKAQAAFNAFVRARDHGLPCISCGAMPEQKRGGTMDAGHYRSTGACPQLRFEPLNCHRQCVRCNRDLSGNSVEYRKALVRGIGQAAVDWLEGPHESPKYTVAELREIASHYSRLTRTIQNRREAKYA